MRVFFATVLVQFLLSACFAASAPWQLSWISSTGQKLSVPTYIVQQKGLILMAAKAPAAAEAAYVLANGHRSKIFLKNINKATFVYLPYASGKVDFTTSDARSHVYNFSIVKHSAELKLGQTCLDHGIDVTILTKDLTVYPAYLDCRYKGNIISSVAFSSMQDAKWYGAGIFEAAGKGERYKVFNGKDVVNLKNLDIAWGADNQKNTARVKLVPLTPPPSAPSNFSFRVGLLYQSGTFQKLGTSTPLSGIEIPLEVQFRPQDSWWLTGGGYRLFVYSTSNTGSTSNSSSELGLWVGGIYEATMIKTVLRLGYSTLNLDIPALGTSSTLAAPQAGLELSLTEKRSFGIEGRYTMTSTSGNYSKLDFGVYYQRPTISKVMTRFGLESTQLSASTNGIDIGANWILGSLTILL